MSPALTAGGVPRAGSVVTQRVILPSCCVIAYSYYGNGKPKQGQQVYTITAATMTQRRTSALDDTILSPGAVKINVQGAFIVDDDASLEEVPGEDGAQHDTRDIRLPNHKAVVSHVALDVRLTRHLLELVPSAVS